MAIAIVQFVGSSLLPPEFFCYNHFHHMANPRRSRLLIRLTPLSIVALLLSAYIWLFRTHLTTPDRKHVLPTKSEAIPTPEEPYSSHANSEPLRSVHSVSSK